MNGVLDILKIFGMDEAVNAVSFGELRADAFTVLEDAARQVGGDADVKHAVRRAGEDVDPAGDGEPYKALLMLLGSPGSSVVRPWDDGGWA